MSTEETRCTWGYPDLLPCGRCEEGCAFKTIATTPAAACGTEGYIPCSGCRPGCVYHERFEAIAHARTIGRWPDGARYDSPTYTDPWEEDDFDWSTGEFRDTPVELDEDGFDWSAGEFRDSGGSAQQDEPSVLQFNPQQMEAIEHYEGAALVIAGAGSGKTGAVTARIVRLVDRGVQPGQILALTFTRKAANEMRERVDDKLGESAKRLTISTFHSLALCVCRDNPFRIDREVGFSIWDDKTMKLEMRRILKAIEEELEEGAPVEVDDGGLPFDAVPVVERVPLPKLPRAVEVLEHIGQRKTGGYVVLCAEFLDWTEKNVHPLAPRIVTEYETLKQAANAVDYDDLIWMAVRTLEEHADILEGYRERWHFVMVDEYQDTNDLQERFLALLVGPRGNLMAVGDEDQSIYGWRGANVSYILNFTSRHPNAALIELGQNYRSTASILAAAASIIANNVNRRAKRLWTENEEGWPVEYPQFIDPFHEADFIGRMIAGSIDQGWVASEHAVLVRTRRQFIALQHALTMMNIPYQTVGWIDFWQRSDVKLVMSWLKVAVNPQDISAGALVFSRWARIGAKTVADWRTGLSQGRSSHGIFDSMNYLHGNRGCGLKTKRGQSIVAFTTAYKTLMNEVRSGSMTIQQIVTWLYEITGLNAEIAQGLEGDGRIAEEAQGRKALRDDFIAMCPGETITNGYQAVTAFLDAIIANAKRDETEEKVTLSTIHSAKGLEWDHVWVAGMVETILPYSRDVSAGMADLDGDELEEERRLAYVACTRARLRLVMSRYQKMTVQGRIVLVKPSRFLIESAVGRQSDKVDSSSSVIVVGDRKARVVPDVQTITVGGRR